jgi:5-formyltetrahydrofolate cyclo-ligase
VFLITTYGILDGFRIVDPSEFSSEHYEFASTLQGIEEYGHKISLAEIACLGGIDLLVTGGFAMSRTNWVRFGKGHGYFDLEAAMLNDAGCLSSDPKVLGIVHDCQVKDFDFPASPLDTRVDIIITGTSTFHAPAGQGFHRTSIDWTRLAPEDLVRMSVLKELQQAQEKEKNS